jgi:hypothetical protein
MRFLHLLITVSFDSLVFLSELDLALRGHQQFFPSLLQILAYLLVVALHVEKNKIYQIKKMAKTKLVKVSVT